MENYKGPKYELVPATINDLMQSNRVFANLGDTLDDTNKDYQSPYLESIDTLYQIKALRDIDVTAHVSDDTFKPFTVHRGTLGGFVSGFHNLSQHDESWIGPNSIVLGSSHIEGTTLVVGLSVILGGVIINSSTIVNTVATAYTKYHINYSFIQDSTLFNLSEVKKSSISKSTLSGGKYVDSKFIESTINSPNSNLTIVQSEMSYTTCDCGEGKMDILAATIKSSKLLSVTNVIGYSNLDSVVIVGKCYIEGDDAILTIRPVGMLNESLSAYREDMDGPTIVVMGDYTNTLNEFIDYAKTQGTGKGSITSDLPDIVNMIRRRF